MNCLCFHGHPKCPAYGYGFCVCDCRKKEKPKTIGFHVGETWFSYDNGDTWTDRHYFDPNRKTGGISMVITKIDHLNGKITVQVV